MTENPAHEPPPPRGWRSQLECYRRKLLAWVRSRRQADHPAATSPPAWERLDLPGCLDRWLRGAQSAESVRGARIVAVRGCGFPCWIQLEPGHIGGLIPVEVRLEASDPEAWQDSPQLAEPRSGTLLVRWNGTDWELSPRLWLNLAPEELLARSGGTWSRWVGPQL